MLTRPSSCLSSRFASFGSSMCNCIPKHRLAPTPRSSSHSPQGKQHLAPEITTKQDLKIFTYRPNSQFHTNFHDFTAFCTCTCFHFLPRPGFTAGVWLPSQPLRRFLQHHFFCVGPHASFDTLLSTSACRT